MIAIEGVAKRNAETDLRASFRANAIVILFFSFLSKANTEPLPVFDVFSYGAVGNGKTLDTEAIQKAIDAAAATGKKSRVLVKAGHHYVIGTLVLKAAIEFFLEGDAELLVSTDKKDYSGEAAIVANGADNLTISGTGSINGRALEFMSNYEKEAEWWIPKAWRPKLFILTSCNDLVVKNITVANAPSWSLHLLGCERVLI